MTVLVLNAGSSSIKYQLFAMPRQQVMARGSIEKIGEETSFIRHTSWRDGQEKNWQKEQAIADHHQGLEKVSTLLLDKQYGVITDPDEVSIVGHRVVHGGEYFQEAVVITEEVQKHIEQLTPLAPLHNPANLMGIDVARQVFANAQQVAVFDTAFHQTLPAYAFRYPIPNQLYYEYHIRVYGMHGTSHQYVAQAAADFLQQPLTALNLITTHLGNGCSMAAVQAGKSIDTSMGFTPLAGLMMGTRSGDIDPAIVYHLHREATMDVEAIDQLLNNESGVKGITGTNDLRAVVQAYEAGDAIARLALEMYCYRIKKYIGAYLAVLGHVDALVFTAGVGENSALVRALSCAGMSHLGILVDPQKNVNVETGARAIEAENSKVRVLVIPTDEELAIAQQSFGLVSRL